MVADSVGRQCPIHLNFVFVGGQLVEDDDVLRADRVFWSRVQAHQRGGIPCPRRRLLSRRTLLTELLVEYFDEVAETLLTEADFSFFFGFLVHLDLDGLSQLILVLLNHLQGLDQRILVGNAFLGVAVGLSQVGVLGGQVLRARGLLQEDVLVGVNCI